MKKIRKILLILSLSFYLTAVLTPQKEKEANAFILTGSLVLGALAIVGAGGVIAYNNRDAIAELGGSIALKLSGTGVNVNDMFADNKYGLTDVVKQKMAESITEKKLESEQIENIKYTNTVKMGFSTASRLLSQELYDAAISSGFLIVTIKHIGADVDPSALKYRFSSDPYVGLLSGIYGTVISTSKEYTKLSVTAEQLIFSGRGHFMVQNGFYQPVIDEFDVSFEPHSAINHSKINAYSSIPTHADMNEYINTINQAYPANDVSIDYDKLNDALTNAQAEPISLTNLESLVSGIEDAVIDAGSDTVGVLTTIWNGIKNIPTLIQSSSTAILGGISTLTDDLLTGLGNFTDNMTKANEQLWEDAGAVWSGMTNAIEKAGADTREAITPALTGIDELLRDMGSTLADLPRTIRTGIADGLTGLNDTVTDLSSKVGAIPSAVSTGVTDAFTSAFTVPDNYIIERVTTIREILIPKLPQFPSRDALFPSDFQEQEDWAGISVDFSHYGIGEQMVVDNVAPNFYRRQIKLWISAILYFFTALFVIRKVAGVINK